MKALSPPVRWTLALVAASGAWMMLVLILPREHNPSDGIVGTPVFRNYSERREKVLYVTAHLLALACGVAAVAGRNSARAQSVTPPGCKAAGTTRPSRWSRAAATAATCSAIYALFVWVARFDAHWDGFHEGARLNYAQAALDGKVPYRDFDCVYGLWYGVGQHVAAFELADEVSVHAARRLAHWTAPWLPVAMYWVCWVATRRRVLALAGLGLACLLMFAPPFLIDWPVDHHGFTTRHVWPALGVALMLAYLSSRKLWVIGLAGVVIGLSSLWPLQSALVPLAAVLATLAALPRTEGFDWHMALRAAGWFAAGLALGLLPLSGYLASHQAIADFLAYHAKVLRIHASWNGQMFPTPGELMRRHNWTVEQHLGTLSIACALFYLPLVLTLAACLRLGAAVGRRRFALQHTRLVCLSAAAFVFFFSTIERSDGHHAAYAALMYVPLLLVLLPSAAPEESHRPFPRETDSPRRRGRRGLLRPTRRGVLAMGSTIVCLAAGAYPVVKRVGNYAARDALRDTKLAGRYSELPRMQGVAHFSVRNAQLIREVGRHVERYTQPDEALLDLSDWFGAHFLYRRKAPGRFYYSYDAVSPLDQMRIVRDLDKTHVVILPLDSADQQPASVDGVPAAVRYHIVLEHLLERFEPYSFPFLLNARRQRENSGYALLGPRRRESAEPEAGEDDRLPDWVDAAPRELHLGFVPYFGEAIFATTDNHPQTRSASGSPPAGAARVEPLALEPNAFDRRMYEVSSPTFERAPRMLRVRIACTGRPQEGFLGWTIANDPHPRGGWRLQFELSRRPTPHIYVFKLAAIPQWVWAKQRQSIFLDLPSGAVPSAAWWE